MHRDEKRIPGTGNERGEGDSEGVLAGLFCAFVCFSFFSFVPCFPFSVSLVFFLMFCPYSSLLQFVFRCSLNLIPPGLPLFYPIFSPVSVSYSSSLLLSIPSLTVFFFSFLCHSLLVSPPGFPPRSFSPLFLLSPLSLL